jgi:SAM-dependent methyltransferase
MKIDIQKTKEFYENISSVWPDNDSWQHYSKCKIEEYICNLKIPDNYSILNAGSGGNDYGLKSEMFHVDIAENKISQFPKYVVASIDNLPFSDNQFDMIICVGSVLNYTDALASITELSRVLKKNGQLILEFESSWGLEHINTSSFKQDASVVSVKYNGVDHTQWIYSPKYIKSIINNNSIEISDTYCWHFISGLNYYFTKDENKAAKWTKFDYICRNLPFIKKHSNNILFKCKKL